MVAVKAGQAAQFLKAPPAAMKAVLFFGSDPGLVAERGATLAKLLAARETPEGEVLRLDDSDLETDGERLAIELNTRPMFSGRKIIRAVTGRRITAALIKSLLNGGPLEGFLVVEAGNLKPDDSLRALFEKDAGAAAVACYPDSDADLEGLANEVLSAHGLKIDAEARDLLVSRLGADRAQSRAEIEKLALYALGKMVVTADDVDTVVGDASDLALEKIAEAAAEGDARRAIADYGRAIASGESAQAIILITQPYFLRLHRIRSDIDGGRSLDDVLRALRPPLHFKSRDAVARQARRWTKGALDLAVKRTGETAKSARLNSAIEETLGERMVLALAAMAGAKEAAAPRR